jgi:hypothetical protein
MKPLFLSLVLFTTLAAFAYAADVPAYQPIVSIPGVDSSMTIEGYIDALFKLSITIAGLIAVVKIIFSGVKWMLSDVVTDKSSAKKDIRGAIFGLLIILTAVLILNTINSNLTVLNIFGGAPAIDIPHTQTEDEARDTVREDYATVGSTYALNGSAGSAEHLTFIRQCVASGGKAVVSAADSNIVECRTK